MYKKILIIADIEGSTGCGSYDASSFNTEEWYDACIDMSLDINKVVRALFDSGVEKIYVKDFHRTGYNLLPELIDRRARIIHGYRKGPVPGIGKVFDADAVMFIGMHASSGSGGFLAHTLTSRYSKILINGRRVSELQLFASALHNYPVMPLFFSGCPAACREAAEDIPGIAVFSVDKDKSGHIDKSEYRKNLAEAAAASLYNDAPSRYIIQPPFDAGVQMRDGSAAAKKIAKRWDLNSAGDMIYFTCKTFTEFYDTLLKMTYFIPQMQNFTSPALRLFNLYGRIGLFIVRRKRRREIKGFTARQPQ